MDFLDQVEAAIPSSFERVYVVLDNLATHKAYDVLLFHLAHPCWEFVFQPKYAAYLNLIEPWWKTLKSLADLREAVRNVGGDGAGCRQSQHLLESAQTSLCLGKAKKSSPSQEARHRLPA